MTTLSQLAWPTLENPLEFIVVALGFIVLIALIVQLIRTKRTKSMSPYSGVPALISNVILGVVLIGGMAVDLSQWPAVVAGVIGFLVKLVTSAFLWPFFIMSLVTGGIRVFSIATYKLK